MLLVYSKLSLVNEQRKNPARDPVLNQFYSRFQEYYLLANAENLNNYPSQSGNLPDPFKTLAVREFSTTRRFFGEEYTCNTDVFFRRSMTPQYENCMQDKQIMSYMVELQKWIQKYICNQTYNENNPNKGQKLT